jgi:hypothetical protein
MSGAGRTVGICRGTVRICCLDDAEQPQDQDQDEQSAKTDIHDTSSHFDIALETVRGVTAFPSLRWRHMFDRYYFTRQETTGFA